MSHDIGPITAADEFLYHQIPDTFAVTATSDRNWTEKIWLTAFALDGSLQANFGFGKYNNRNVMDGFAGVSRGVEQWTVRGNRTLYPDPLTMSIGPLSYEIVEPLKQVRVRLEENDAQPIAYDITFTGELPPFFEARNRHRSVYRLESDTVRYHQLGHADGWVSVNGERTTVDGATWGSARDHSWGERGERLVGGLPPGVQVPPVSGGGTGRSLALWAPLLMTRPDGSKYEIQFYLIEGAHGDGPQRFLSGHVSEADGSQQEIVKIEPNITLAKRTRYVTGGSYGLTLASGEERVVEIEPQGASGFHLRPGRYGVWRGAVHGHWLGDLVVEGDYIADCSRDLKRIGQSRDMPVRVRDGDAVGYGIHESIISGDWSAEYGVGPESDFGRGIGDTPEDA